MSFEEYWRASNRLARATAALRLHLAAARISRELRFNPNWRLQPRIPSGMPGGGRWTEYLFGTVTSILPLLQRLGPQAVGKLREVARRLLPSLRRMPKPWAVDRQPSDESYDSETRRISRNSWQRFGEPHNIRFRNEDELRRILGPAGKGREWHHIVEKRLAGREGFPAELIHSTDNIISLPIDVHRRVSAKMSSSHRDFDGQLRRFWLEKMDFATQYDHGLRLIEETLRELGYDPSEF